MIVEQKIFPEVKTNKTLFEEVFSETNEIAMSGEEVPGLPFQQVWKNVGIAEVKGKEMLTVIEHHQDKATLTSRATIDFPNSILPGVNFIVKKCKDGPEEAVVVRGKRLGLGEVDYKKLREILNSFKADPIETSFLTEIPYLRKT